MSDTERRGTSSEAGAPKSKSRRGRGAVSPAEAAPKPEGETVAASPIDPAGRSSAEPGVDAGIPPAEAEPADKASSAQVLARDQLLANKQTLASEQQPAGLPDRASDQATREGSGARISDLDESGPPPQSGTPPPERDGPKAPPEEPASPWRGSGDAARPPLSSRPKPTGARALALAALLLSLILPGALYAYLAASGVFERDPARLARLESSIEALRAAPLAKPDVSRADFDKLAARLDQLEKALAAEAQRPQASSPSGSTASLEAVATQIEAASRDAKEALSLARTAADSANSAQAAAARLASVESKLVVLEKQLAILEQSVSSRPKADVNAPSILVMARAIEVDLKSGVAYVGELDALSRLGVDAKLVETLRPFAEKGAPSAASLAADFEAELEAAREKVANATPPANLWDRLTALLGRIVRVRHIGADEAGSPAGTVETALLRGEVAGARDAWDALPVFEKSATPVSGGHIKALADAEAASRRIGAVALEAIRRSGSTDNGG
jgi:hypothetical protein